MPDMVPMVLTTGEWSDYSVWGVVMLPAAVGAEYARLKAEHEQQGRDLSKKLCGMGLTHAQRERGMRFHRQAKPHFDYIASYLPDGFPAHGKAPPLLEHWAY